MYLIEKLILMSLPFMKALTIDVGFPLKIYEALSVFLILFHSKHLKDLQPAFRFVFRPLFLFLFICVISLGVGYYIISDYEVVFEISSWRHQPIFAGVLKLFYILLVVYYLAYFLARTMSSVQLAQMWLIGAALASLYGLHIFLFLKFGLTPFSAPGLGELDVDMLGRVTTFAEGNFASSFFVLSFALTLFCAEATRHRRYLLLLPLFFFSILQTQSTAGFLAFLVICLPLMTIPRYVPFGLAFFIILIGLISISPDLQSAFIEKLTSDEINVYTYSRYDRLFSIQTAWNLMLDYPVLGVGLQNYGILLPNVDTSFLIPELNFDIASSRRIVNNVYLEIGSELGFLGLASFLWFLKRLIGSFWKCSKAYPQRILFGGLVSVFVSWFAYPTFTSLYHWVFFAIALKSFHESYRARNQRQISEPTNYGRPARSQRAVHPSNR